ncbi:MAG: hypothetical protein H6811_03000 [Phycisphaeraceae bacterium]|nr:hypothetical protein [Phycisphaeraceae bacterium]
MKRPWQGWWIDAIGLGAIGAIVAGAITMGVREREGIEEAWTVRAKQANAQRAELARLATERNELLARLGEQRSEIEREGVTLRPAREINGVLARLSEAALAHGLKVDQLSPSGAAPEGDLRRIGIRMVGHGTFPPAVEALRTLDREFPDVRVEGFEMTGTPLSLGQPSQFTLDLSWLAVPDA